MPVRVIRPGGLFTTARNCGTPRALAAPRNQRSGACRVQSYSLSAISKVSAVRQGLLILSVMPPPILNRQQERPIPDLEPAFRGLPGPVVFPFGDFKGFRRSPGVVDLIRDAAADIEPPTGEPDSRSGTSVPGPAGSSRIPFRRFQRFPPFARGC